MKTKALKKVLIVTCFLALIAAGATTALGFPTSDTECGNSGCHDTQDVLTISSNATGTVEATLGVPFILVVDASNGANTIKIVSDWANNDQFTFSSTQVEDDDTDDIDTDSGQISAEVSITPNAVGSHTIRIWVAAGGDLARSLDVTVDVEENTDTTFTPTPTPTTPTEPTTDPVETWTTLMYLFNAITAVVLVVLAIIMLKRTK